MYYFIFHKKHSFTLMMISNWYEHLSIVIILCLTFKIIFIECFWIQNFEVETRCHKNKQNKQTMKKSSKLHQYKFFVSFISLSLPLFLSFSLCIYIYIYIFIKKKTTKPITKDYKFISILLRIFEIFKNTKKN